MCARISRAEQTEALELFVKYIVTQSRSNLTKMRINVTDKLYNSLDGSVEVYPNSMRTSISMEDYGKFRDKGVSGHDPDHKYNTPYSFRDKMPPGKVFDKWIVRRGIAPRSAKGRFLDRKALGWAIARSVYKKGIKPSLFFTKPFEAGFKRLPDDLIKIYGLELERFLADVLNSNKV